MAKKAATTYQIQINDLKTLSFSIEDEPTDYKVGTAFTFNLVAGNAVDVTNKNVQVVVTVQIFEPEKESIILSRIQVLLGFHLPDFDSFMDTEQKAIPKDLLDLLHAISISTTRGVLYSALKGTYLEKAILPIINPLSMEPKVLD